MSYLNFSHRIKSFIIKKGLAVLFLFILNNAFIPTINAQNDKLSIDDLVEVKEEDLLDIDVTTASKTSENIKNAPGVISVITSTEIAKFGATNLLEVIEWVTSIYTVGNFFLPQNYISIRGDLSAEYNNHVLILINGRPTREILFGGVDLAVFYGFPMNTIDRIEVIRGPGSVLYGTNAYSGVVNIITKDVKNDETNITSEVGSFGRYGFTAANTKIKDDVKLRTAVQYTREEGWPFEAVGESHSEASGGLIPGDTRDTVSYNAGQNSIGGMFSVGYKNFTFNSLLSYSSQDHYGAIPSKGFPTPAGVFVDAEVRNRTVFSLRGFMDIGYKFNYGESGSLNANLTYNSSFFRLATPSGDAVNKTHDYLLELSNYYSPIENLNWLLGATAYFQRGDTETGDTDGTGVAPFSETWYSAYTQIDYSPTSYLKLIAGGQLNKPAGIDLDFVPRLGAIVNLTPQLGAKLLYGKAFRAAFEAEQSLVDIPAIVGNPDLTPEKVTTTDLQLFYYAKRLQLAATYFNSKQKDVISRVKRFITIDTPGGPIELPVFSFENNNILKLEGLELEAKWTPLDQLFISASFTHQTNVLNDSISGHSLAPENMMKFGAFYNHKAGISLGAFLKYFSEAGVAESMTITNPAADDFILLSTKFHFDLYKIFKVKSSSNLGLDLYGNNLLDEVIFYPEYVRRNINTIPGRSGRAFYAKLIFQF